MSRVKVERNIAYDEEKKRYYVNLDFGWAHMANNGRKHAPLGV